MTEKFPRHASDLTLEFLNDKLKNEFGVINDFNVSPLKQSSFLSELVNIQISTDRKQFDIVGKFIGHMEAAVNLSKALKFYLNEVSFYQEFGKGLIVKTPKCYCAMKDDETHEFVLLLESIDGEKIQQFENIETAVCVKVLKQMAKLHASWYNHPQITQNNWMSRFTDPAWINSLPMLIQAGLESVPRIGYEKFIPDWSDSQAFIALIPEFMAELDQSVHTLVHGDFRTDNILFTQKKNELSLIDWQIVYRGTPMFDFAYMFTMGQSIEQRRSNEKDFLEIYFEEMKRNGAEVDKEALKNEYKAAAFLVASYGMMAPSVTDPSNADQMRTTEAFMTRTSALIEDLDLVERIKRKRRSLGKKLAA